MSRTAKTFTEAETALRLLGRNEAKRRYALKNKDKIAAYMREYGRRNREQLAAKSRARRAGQRTEKQAYDAARYNLQRDKFRAVERARHLAMRERVWGRQCPALCEICGSANSGKRLAADHDHDTGQPRLFLCNRCNTIEGIIRGEWSNVAALIGYHLWLAGQRENAVLTIPLRTTYPASPIASGEDVAWIRRTMERKKKA